MAHIVKENRAKPMQDYVVYVIVSPFNDKTFYISKTKQNRLRKAYAEHFGLRIVKTKALFEKAKEAGLRPALYILENEKMSVEDAFSRSVAWTKYFLNFGYSQIKADSLTRYAADLTDASQKYYDKIKDKQLDEVFQPEGGVFSKYGERTTKKNAAAKTVVSVFLDENEYALIKQRATEVGLSKGAYCKRMSLNGKILQVDYSVIEKYLAEFNSSKTLLKQILYSIYSTGNYYPADLENIQNFIVQLTELEMKVNEEIANTIRTLRE